MRKFFQLLFFLAVFSELTIIEEDTEPDDVGSGPDVIVHDGLSQMNPALVEALKKLNDDPSQLSGLTKLPDEPLLSPERMAEIEEVMEYIYENAPEDDIVSVQKIKKRLDDEDGTSEQIITDLEMLRDFLHQVDNGLDFGKLGGFQTLMNLMTHSDPEVRLQAFWSVGATCSNNLGAIELALSSGLLDSFIHSLETEDNENVLVKTIYALGSMIRQNRQVQYMFDKAQGPNLVKTLYHTSLPKLKRKIESLVVDVVVMNEWNSIFQTKSWCELFLDGVLNSEAPYTQVSNSLQYYANAQVDCPQVDAELSRKFRKRLRRIQKKLGTGEDGDPDINQWVNLILAGKKQKPASQQRLEALPCESCEEEVKDEL